MEGQREDDLAVTDVRESGGSLWNGAEPPVPNGTNSRRRILCGARWRRERNPRPTFSGEKGGFLRLYSTADFRPRARTRARSVPAKRRSPPVQIRRGLPFARLVDRADRRLVRRDIQADVVLHGPPPSRSCLMDQAIGVSFDDARQTVTGAAVAPSRLPHLWRNTPNDGYSEPMLRLSGRHYGSENTTQPNTPAETANPPTRPSETIAPVVADLSRFRS